MTGNDIEVRPACAEDRQALVRLLGVQLGEHGVPLSAEALEHGVDGLLRRPQLGRFLVAAERSEIVGFAALSFLWTLEHGGRAVWLDELYVLPERRGRGIGRTLLGEVYAVAKSVGAGAVDLEIERGHERAARLYEREGFRPLTRNRWARPLPQEGPSRTTRRATDGVWSGGCLCGAVRYRVSAIREVGHCHCSLCRRSSGAPFVTWATVPAGAFAFVAGEPAERASSPKARRTFCRACGTPLTFREPSRPDFVDVTVGSFDHPESVEPEEHIFTASQLPWLRLDDALPRYPEANPAER